MIIVLDSVTKKVKPHPMNGVTSSLYPDGNIPGLSFSDNELVIKIHDNSNIAKKILQAYNYELIFDTKGNVVDVDTTKTLEQYFLENPVSLEPTEADYLLDLDYRLSRLELKL